MLLLLLLLLLTSETNENLKEEKATPLVFRARLLPPGMNLLVVWQELRKEHSFWEETLTLLRPWTAVVSPCHFKANLEPMNYICIFTFPLWKSDLEIPRIRDCSLSEFGTTYDDQLVLVYLELSKF